VLEYSSDVLFSFQDAGSKVFVGWEDDEILGVIDRGGVFVGRASSLVSLDAGRT
jgi:hypothetical protein